MNKILIFYIFFIYFHGIIANPVILHDEVDNAIDEDDDIIDLTHLDGRAFGDPDEEVGKMIQEVVNETSELNPEELGSYFEGDILIPGIQGRSALTDVSRRWSGNIVPYTFEGYFPPAQKAVIDSAINEYHAKTCIRFKPRSSESDYIVFKPGSTGCWSSVGRIGGPQTINLQPNGCLSKKGTALHEIAHALGIFHEQNRADRDNHVRIRHENIQNGLEANFEKLSSSTTSTFGVPYDYGSVMHYSASAFSKNGQPTIVALQGSSSSMGQRDGFSASDIKRIRTMYNCGGTGGGSGSGSVPGRPIGTNKPRPTSSSRPSRPSGSSSGGGTRPIKPIAPIRPIRPMRPAAVQGFSNNGGGGAGAGNVGNAFQQMLGNVGNAFMQGIGQVGSSLVGSIGNSLGFQDENEEKGRKQ